MKLATVLALSLAAGSPACTGTTVFDNVVYDERFGASTAMDIHVPDDDATARPAVMLIHGGAWRLGDKSNYTDAAERLAKAGYVAATINYRLVPAGIYPSAVQDCLCALSFLRANAASYGIDPDRIAVSGYSAGGHLSALVGTAADLPDHQPDCEWGSTGPPAAAIPGDSNYDFTTREQHDAIVDFLGGTYAEVPDRYVAASPLLHVGPETPPFLVIHGADDLVPIEGARELVEELRANGNPVRFLELADAGHVTSASTTTNGESLQTASDTPEAWAVVLDFLDHTLGAP